MLFAPYITMQGLGKQAVEFYQTVFSANIERYTFLQCRDAFPTPLPLRCEALIYRAVLTIPGMDGRPVFSFIVADSPVLLFSEGPFTGNRDNLTIEVDHPDKTWIVGTYEKLMQGGKSNYMPQVKPLFPLSCSLIDNFGVCWILNQVP